MHRLVGADRDDSGDMRERSVIAGLFVLETLSVLLQMSYFKLTRRLTGTGRRIFRITPSAPLAASGIGSVVLVGSVGVIAGGAVGGLVAANLGLTAPLFLYAGILAFAVAFYIPRYMPAIANRPAAIGADAAIGEALAAEAPLPSKGPVLTML